MSRFLLLVSAILVLGGVCAAAREWRSADGAKTIDAAFAGLKDERVLLTDKEGKQMVHPLSLFSVHDQEYARLAQVSLNGAKTLGPQTFEITCVADAGFIARIGVQLTGPKGPWVFSGETFFLPKGKLILERGDRLESKLLYYAGNRTFQPLEADSSVIRAFALDLNEAVDADLRIRAVSGGDQAKLAPIVAEPLIEIVSTRGLALPLGKGYFITESDLVTDVATLVFHEDGKDVPAKVIKADPKLGLALLTCAVEMEPVRLLARKPAELGQNIFAITLSLTSLRKNLGSPSLTRGIISKASGSTSFEHDAAIAESAVGGFVLSDKWELLGIFFRSQSRVESKRPTKSTTDPELPPLKGVCIRTDTFEKLFIIGEKIEAKRMPGVPTLKSGTLGDEAPAVIEMLRKNTALVVATREVKHDPPTRKPVAAGTPQTGQPQFSLSVSGTRHNFRCRYFDLSKTCQSTQGKPCKVCGG